MGYNTYNINQKDIWTYENKDKSDNRIQKGERPCIIVSNNISNKHSELVHIVPLTMSHKPKLPTHVDFNNKYGYKQVALCEQIHLIPKTWLIRYLDYNVNSETWDSLCEAIKVQFGIE